MNIQSCYYPTCDHEAEVCCNCTSPEIYSCNRHFVNHCKSSNKSHNLSPIVLKPVEDTRRAVLKFLDEQNLKIDVMKTKLIQSFYQTYASYESALKEILNEIESESPKIISYFDKVSQTKEITKFEKDPVLNLLTLQPFEAVQSLKVMFTENENIMLLNGMLDSVNNAILNFNQAKLKATPRKIIFQPKAIQLALNNESGKLQVNLKKYGKLIEKEPNNDNAYYEIGKLFYDEKRYLEALEYFNDAILINSNITIYHINKGMTLYNLERREDAMNCYEDALSISPDKDSIYNDIGIMLYNEKKYEEALLFYNRAIKINPNKQIYYINKANGLEVLERLEEAIECYKEASKFNPYIPICLNIKIADAFFSLKNYKEAIKYYDGMIGSNDYHNREICIKRGEAFYGLGKRKKAIACFRKVLERWHNERAYHGLGVIYLGQNKYYKALDCYKNIISRNNTKAIYYRNQGIAYYGIGQNYQAIESFESAIRIDPNDDYSYNLAGRLYYLGKNYEKALEYYNNAIRINPNKTIYYENKIDVFKKIGRIEEAQECFRKAQSIKKSS